MQKINREQLVNEFESIKAGLSPREIIEQSSCFVFKDGNVMTYNDEIACTLKCSLKIDGAVQAEPLVAVLGKMPSEFVEITTGEGELVIKAGNSRASGIRMENEILLPIHNVEVPEVWKPLPDDFVDAVTIVAECACTDESQFVLTCINITPKWIEACDNFQLARYPLKLDLSKPCLARAKSLVHLVELGMTEFAETHSWIHFRNSTGLIFSCRKTVDEYPDLTNLLKVEGAPATLPKGLAEAATAATIFSSENADKNTILINLSPKEGGRLQVLGEGASGWYKEKKKLKYAGDPLKFRISPKLLIDLTKRHNECSISSTCLLVNAGKFRYVTCLGAAEE